MAGANPIPGGGCGFFQPSVDSNQNISGGYIQIYAQTHTTPPYDCSQEINFVIEHEMGHTQNLGDPNDPHACLGWPMGAPSSPTAGIVPVTNDDCIVVNQEDVTTQEQGCAGGCTAGYRPPDQFGCAYGDLIDECGCCMHYSPIIIDLSGRGVEMSSLADGVVFDLNGYGDLRRIAWPASPDNGWLALDRNHNGRVDGGNELFGTATPLMKGGFAENGYEALAELDENHDGMIDRADPLFASLVIWLDLNRNGVSEAGELTALRDVGIAAISLDVRQSARTDRWGNRFTLRSKVIFSTPPERFSYDVFPVVGPPTTR
jgi:hypothetical protein